MSTPDARPDTTGLREAVEALATDHKRHVQFTGFVDQNQAVVATTSYVEVSDLLDLLSAHPAPTISGAGGAPDDAPTPSPVEPATPAPESAFVESLPRDRGYNLSHQRTRSGDRHITGQDCHCRPSRIPHDQNYYSDAETAEVNFIEAETLRRIDLAREQGRAEGEAEWAAAVERWLMSWSDANDIYAPAEMRASLRALLTADRAKALDAVKAQAKAEALREAADEIGEGDGISRFIGMDSLSEAVRAEKRAQQWLRARVDQIGGQS